MHNDACLLIHFVQSISCYHSSITLPNSYFKFLICSANSIVLSLLEDFITRFAAVLLKNNMYFVIFSLFIFYFSLADVISAEMSNLRLVSKTHL